MKIFWTFSFFFMFGVNNVARLFERGLSRDWESWTIFIKLNKKLYIDFFFAVLNVPSFLASMTFALWVVQNDAKREKENTKKKKKAQGFAACGPLRD